MGVILLTFLGTGNYQPCRYSFPESEVTGEAVTFYSAALAARLKPDRVVSFQTEHAASRNGEDLAASLASLGCEHDVVRIADGSSEDELWQIFAVLTRHVPENCTLYLDITHGFRSLPVLGFIALSYLRVTRRVNIGGIYYGAWEARDPASNVAPTFDLTPFLTLLDWTAAADQFLATGSAVRLGEMLSQRQQALRMKPVDFGPSELPKKLKTLGKFITESSMNLLLLRTNAFAGTREKLAGKIGDASPEARVFATPFMEVLSPVRDALSRFSDIELGTLRELVKWLADRRQTAASLTLASEWITSYAMVICGESVHHAGHVAREPYSRALAILERGRVKGVRDEKTQKAEDVLGLLESRMRPEQIAILRAVSNTIRNARNDINHAGFNEEPASADALSACASRVAVQLKELDLP
jgi:CRISPR-associated DxTHG motif protein